MAFLSFKRLGLLALAAATCLVLASTFVLAQDSGPTSQQHVVARGETLYTIAARYGVTVDALAQANDISDPGAVQVGQRLNIPAPAGQSGRIHIVKRGETLSGIAAQYGVTVQDIVRANNLINPNNIYIGQRLSIPVIILPTPTPTATAPAPSAPTPEAVCPAGCEAISIISPTTGMTVSNPVAVSGLGSAFEQTLVVRVLDGSGYEIGLGYAVITGAYGLQGAYSGLVTYTAPSSAQLGRIQVYSLSPRDGAIEHLTSVVVAIPGAGLDSAIEGLQAALAAKDYGALQAQMAERWVLGFYGSEGVALKPAQAIRQLRTNYLGPGEVTVDLSVDAMDLLGDRLELPPQVTHVLYSTGWGPDQADDAFLLLAQDEDGQTRWSGMLYVFDALRDYQP